MSLARAVLTLFGWQDYISRRNWKNHRFRAGRNRVAMSTPEEDAAATDETSYWDQLDAESLAESNSEPADWSGDELEQAYLRAIEVLEASDVALPEASISDSTDADDSSPLSPGEERSNSNVSSIPDAPVITAAERAEATGELQQLAAQRTATATEPPPAVVPRQILEACLFVGGEPLTAKKMSGVLRGEFSIEFIERELDELNTLYTSEGRPYEIRLGEGGYRLTLRDDFERIRNKAYGLGPKEVRLSQEALEVLAVVGYHQPIAATAIEELGKPGSSAVLRQLLRRELIAVERSADKPREVAYHTTPRFLSLFGIRSLDELPRHEQVGYK